MHKNAASNTEQVLETTPHKKVAVKPPTTHRKTIQIRRTRHAGHGGDLQHRHQPVFKTTLSRPVHRITIKLRTPTA